MDEIKLNMEVKKLISLGLLEIIDGKIYVTAKGQQYVE